MPIPKKENGFCKKLSAVSLWEKQLLKFLKNPENRGGFNKVSGIGRKPVVVECLDIDFIFSRIVSQDFGELEKNLVRCRRTSFISPRVGVCGKITPRVAGRLLSDLFETTSVEVAQFSLFVPRQLTENNVDHGELLGCFRDR